MPESKPPNRWTEIGKVEIDGEPVTVHFMAANLRREPGITLTVDGHPATFVSPWDFNFDGRWADFFVSHARKAVRFYR